MIYSCQPTSKLPSRKCSIKQLVEISKGKRQSKCHPHARASPKPQISPLIADMPSPKDIHNQLRSSQTCKISVSTRLSAHIHHHRPEILTVSKNPYDRRFSCRHLQPYHIPDSLQWGTEQTANAHCQTEDSSCPKSTVETQTPISFQIPKLPLYRFQDSNQDPMITKWSGPRQSLKTHFTIQQSPFKKSHFYSTPIKGSSCQDIHKQPSLKFIASPQSYYLLMDKINTQPQAATHYTESFVPLGKESSLKDYILTTENSFINSQNNQPIYQQKNIGFKTCESLDNSRSVMTTESVIDWKVPSRFALDSVGDLKKDTSSSHLQNIQRHGSHKKLQQLYSLHLRKCSEQTRTDTCEWSR